MRTVYEILKEVGLDHKDAVLIDFCYSRVLHGSAPQNIGSMTNEASEILNKKTGLYGANGSAFWSYLDLQSRLEEKFPAGKPITFYVPLTRSNFTTLVSILEDLNMQHPASYKIARNIILPAWENRKVI